MCKALVAGALLILFAVPVQAQTDSGRPITMIVTVPPGGSSDALARLTAHALSTKLNRSVIVENVTGAGGLVGAQKFLRSPPDGNTLLFINQSLVILPHLHKKFSYSPISDVEPVSVVAKVPMVLSVSNQSGIKDLPSLIAKMKNSPDKVNIGSGGPGTTAHFAEALFLKLANTKAHMIQYRGSGPALTDLMAGTIDVVIDQTVTMLPLHAGKRVKAIAVSGSERTAQAMDIPTFAEGGLPQFDLAIWNGVVAPKGTPKPMLEKLQASLTEAVSTPDFNAKLRDMGAQGTQAQERGPVHFRKLISQDAERVQSLVKDGAFASE
ncbi:ABC transporter substrate-binding protein [Cupriavidus sp. UYMU48A]|nr:ABC transporter substrate-binding protein [Cupriavidus sp. UYMU48A]